MSESSIDCLNTATRLPTDWGARLDPKRSWPICNVPRICRIWDCGCPARPVRFIGFSKLLVASRASVHRDREPWPLRRSQGSAGKWTRKDASSVTLDALGKHQHLVEVLNIVDIGSSQLLEAEVREDFHAQTTLTSRAVIFRRRGRPIQLTRRA
jgi:hypothetical protein